MKHSRTNTPVYVIHVKARPSSRGKGKEAYYQAVRDATVKVIEKPIASNDIEVDICYSTSTEPGQRMDADNVNKPTLDALKSVAYNDDAQVRDTRVTLVDRENLTRLEGKADEMQRLLFGDGDDVVLIKVFSDSRLAELGGPENAERRRMKEWAAEHDQLW